MTSDEIVALAMNSDALRYLADHGRVRVEHDEANGYGSLRVTWTTLGKDVSGGFGYRVDTVLDHATFIANACQSIKAQMVDVFRKGVCSGCGRWSDDPVADDVVKTFGCILCGKPLPHRPVAEERSEP